MDCSDFQAKLDLYLDGVLAAIEMTSAAEHARRCSPCDQIVTGYQKTRALLKTAVTDRVTAVDVSGLWLDVARRLDAGDAKTSAPVASLDRVRSDRWSKMRPRMLRDRPALQLGAVAAMAAAAVLVVGITFGGRERDQKTEIARGGLVQSRPVRIDSMEVAAGHTVSTWVKPRTKTRVIWVASSDGFGVSHAAHSR